MYGNTFSNILRVDQNLLSLSSFLQNSETSIEREEITNYEFSMTQKVSKFRHPIRRHVHGPSGHQKLIEWEHVKRV